MIPPTDLDAEMATIGAALLAQPVAGKLIDRGVRAHHFSSAKLSRVWEAIVGLETHAKPVDVMTVAAEVDRLGGLASTENVRNYVDSLAGSVPSIANAFSYADRVLELAEWRARLLASIAMQEAVQGRDLPAWARAEALLSDAHRERRFDSLSPEAWGTLLFNYLQEPKAEGFIPLPFPALTQGMGGGLQPGEIMLVAGYTGHGKSIYADMILDTAAKLGRRCHLYMTEMTATQRGLRYLARHSGVPFGALRSRTLDATQMSKALDTLKSLPYGVSIVSDWDIEDVVADALRARWDLVVIDLIHGFHYQDERGLDRLSKAASRLARVSTTREGYRGTAVIEIAHLSNAQMQNARSPERPKPGMHSIKGASSLSQDVDWVCFVWQQDTEEGIPSGSGNIWLPKARSGDHSGVSVMLNTSRLRFDEIDERYV